MINFELDHWYTVEFANGEKSVFKVLNKPNNPASIAYDVEFCNGERKPFVLSQYKNIIHHGVVSPCEENLTN